MIMLLGPVVVAMAGFSVLPVINKAVCCSCAVFYLNRHVFLLVLSCGRARLFRRI